MNMNEKRLAPGVAMALIFAVGAVVCVWILSRAVVKARRNDDMIRVVGSARKAIHADFIIWNGSVTEQAPTVAQGYASLKAKMAIVLAYLKKRGIPVADATLSAISVQNLYVKP